MGKRDNSDKNPQVETPMKSLSQDLEIIPVGLRFFLIVFLFWIRLDNLKSFVATPA